MTVTLSQFKSALQSTSCMSGVLASAAIAAAPLSASALPQGGQVAHGNVQISSGANTTTINQASQRGIINWNSFDVAAGQTARFNQPNASAITLNRVTGSQNPSQIHGNLTANGRVVLINPNGVHFGATSRIDVNGLIASTADISDRDFINGQFNFNRPGNPNAKIINAGTITARQGGLVALVAPGVENHGVIRADRGTIAMGAGETATFDFYGDKLINFAVDGQTAQGITNSGTVSAAGGEIYMTAAAVTQVIDNVINTTGVIEASSAHMEGGVIVLGGGNGGVKVSGKVKATGTRGGEIDINGGNVELAGATIDASGAFGGGIIRVGGDGHTDRAGLADTAIVDATSFLIADALSSGDGGNITIWSREATNFRGNISAKGPRDGGFAEVSSVGMLGYFGLADLSGGVNNGLLLLDPDRVIIGNNASDDGDLLDNGTILSGDAGDTLRISATAIQFALSTASVIIEAINDVIVNAAIDGSAAPAGNGLTLKADTVRVNQDITLNNAALNLFGNTIAVNGNVTLGNGNLVARGVDGTGVVTRFTQNASSTVNARRFDARGGVTNFNSQGNWNLNSWLRMVLGERATFGGTVTAGGRFQIEGGDGVTVNNVTATRIRVSNTGAFTANGNLKSNGTGDNGFVSVEATNNINLRGDVESEQNLVKLVSDTGNVSVAGTLKSSLGTEIGGRTVTLEQGAEVGGELKLTAQTNLQLGDKLTYGSQDISAPRITILDNDASIQQGLDLVDDEGTVNVKAGTYTQGGLRLRDGKSLIGDGKDQTFINASGNFNALRIDGSADGSQVRGISFGSSLLAAISIKGDIERLIFNDVSARSRFGTGVVVSGGSTINNWSIANSMFDGNFLNGMWIREGSMVDRFTVRNTSFSNNGLSGLHVDRHSEISRASFGANDNGRTRFDGNNDRGALIEGGTQITFDDVSFSDNGSWGLDARQRDRVGGFAGFIIDRLGWNNSSDLSNITVRNSTISGNETGGIRFKADEGQTLSWTRVYDNTFGANQTKQIQYDGNVEVRFAEGGPLRGFADQTERNEIIGDLVANNNFGTLVYLTDTLDGNWIGDTVLWGKIQPVVDAAESGNWVNIGEGVYDETVLVTKSLNLIGLTEDKTKVVIRPTGELENSFRLNTDDVFGNAEVVDGGVEQEVQAQFVEAFRRGDKNDDRGPRVLPIVMVDGATVTMQNFTVDGSELTHDFAPNEGLAGIGLNGAGGTLNNLKVTNIYDDGRGQATGVLAQTRPMRKGPPPLDNGDLLDNVGVAFAADNAQAGFQGQLRERRQLIISNTDIDQVQYSGISAHGLGLSATILNNSIAGDGREGEVVQSLIRLSGGVSGGVFGNVITDLGVNGSIGIDVIRVSGSRVEKGIRLGDIGMRPQGGSFFIEGNAISGANRGRTTGIQIAEGAMVGGEEPRPCGDFCLPEGEQFEALPVEEGQLAQVDLVFDEPGDIMPPPQKPRFGTIRLLDNAITSVREGIDNSADNVDMRNNDVTARDTGIRNTGDFVTISQGVVRDADRGIWTNGLTDINGVALIDNEVGIRARGGADVRLSDVSVSGGDVGLRASGRRTRFFFDDDAGSSFSRQLEYAIELQNNIMDDQDIFVGTVTFNGQRGDQMAPSLGEAQVFDENDLASVGDIAFTGSEPSDPPRPEVPTSTDESTIDTGGDTGGTGGDTGTGGGGVIVTPPVVIVDDGTDGGDAFSFLLAQIEQNRNSNNPPLFSFFGETTGQGFSFTGTLADLSLLAGNTNFEGLSAAQLAGLQPAAGPGSSSNPTGDGEANCGNSFLSSGFQNGFSAAGCQ